MLQVSLNDRPPSIETCLGILSSHNARFGIPLDYDRLLEYYAYYNLEATRMRKNIERAIGFKSVIGEPMKPDDLLIWIQRAGGTLDGFLKTAKGKISLNKDSIAAYLSTGLQPKHVYAVVNMFAEYNNTKSTVTLISGILDTHQILALPTYDGHRMAMARPTWSAQNTGRLGMSNPALINLSKKCKDVQTVPEGWVFIEVDSTQIEPREVQSSFIEDPLLKKCTLAYNDAYFGYLHYCTILTPEDIMRGDAEIVPLEITEELQAKRKRLKTFGNAVMYGSTSNVDNDPVKAAFIERIGKHPTRVAKVKEMERKIMAGERIFYTAFGTPIDITKGPSDKNYPDKTSEAYMSHLIKCAINNPIQGTAADLMRISVAKANMLLATKAPNSFILKYTHDSGTFAVHESEYDKVANELKEITSYQVTDKNGTKWIPIYGDVQEGWQNTSGLERLVNGITA